MEDSAIVELYWARDEAAIAESDGKYGALCRRTSEQLLRSREDAEECVNDTWGRAWNAMPPQRPDSLRAFLLRIVRNVSIDRWRTLRAGKRGDGLGTLVLELEDCVPAAPSAEAQWESRRIAAAVHCWLETLPAADRALFLRRYWFGASVAEAARDLGITANGAAQRLRRLRLRLKAALESEGVVL